MKTLILATAAVLALGAGSAFAAETAQTQSRMNDTQMTYAQAANSNGTPVYSGTSNQLFPSFQGGA